MQQLFRAAVHQAGVPVAVITGDRSERFARATEAIDALLLADAPDALREDDANPQE